MSLNILDLVRRHGIELRKASGHQGGEYHGPCPGCGGEDRFHVWPEQNNGEGSYWCRQCGRGGDGIQFLRDFDGMTFHQACEFLEKPLPDSRDLRQPKDRDGSPWEPRTYDAPEEQWSKKALAFIHWCYDQLFEHPEALGYLTGRGLREGTLAAFMLGWNPGKDGKDLYRSRESWGLSRIINEKTGRPRPLWLPRGFVIPWDRGGVPVRIRIRRPDPLTFGPRYYAVPGSVAATMVIPATSTGDRSPAQDVFVVVESELDGILLHQEAGDLVGVVALGSAQTRPDEAAAEILRKSAHILNALDFDRAGAKEHTWWKEHFPEAARWPVPKGKDPGEAYHAGVDLREWILAGLPEGLKFLNKKGAN